MRSGFLALVAGLALALVAVVWHLSLTAPAGQIHPPQGPFRLTTTLESSSKQLSTSAIGQSQGVVTTVPTNIAISATANPTLTSKGVRLKGNVAPAAAPDGGATPTGTVSWNVTSSTGQSVPCAFELTKLGKAGKTWCKIAPHELSAADGPYTVTLSCPGDSKFSASTQTFTLQISPANSRTRLAVAPAAGSGSPASFTAKVTGLPSSAGTPTGAVTFAGGGSSGPVQCSGGTNTLTLASGVATCTVSSAPVASGAPYAVQATYSGDGNFNRSVSTSASSPHSRPSSVSVTTGTPPNGPSASAPAAATAPAAAAPTAPATPTASAPQSGGMSAPPGYTNQQLIFDDQFTGTTLDTTKWNTFMAGQGSGPSGHWGPSAYNWGPGNNFTATGTTTHQTFFDPARVVVNNGLSLTMTYDPTYAAGGWNTRSGCISTWNKFTFTSGFVQVKAEFPDSTAGQWPAIWLLPNNAPNGGGNGDEEIDMHEGGFLPNETGAPSNTPINNNYAPNYHQPSGAQVLSFAGANLSADLSGGYHIYGMQVTAGQSVTFYLDGTPVAQTNIGVTTEPWEIVIWNAFATSAASGYHTTGNASALTPSTLHVAEVQVYG